MSTEAAPLGTRQASDASRVRSALVALSPLLIYLVARAISAMFIIASAGHQPNLTHDPTWHVEGTRPADPSYWQILSNWDGQWFKTIAVHGYSGVVVGHPPVQNVLGFAPLYPLLVRSLMRVTGGSFEVVASCVSLLCGAVAVVLLHRWLITTRGRVVALVAVAVLSFFPSSPILQAAYSDALALLFLVVALRAAVEQRWALLLASSAALALTRPIVIPVALFVVALEVRRVTTGAEKGAKVDRRPFYVAVGVGALAFLWPVVAGVIAGYPTAYADTLSAWSHNGTVAEGWFLGMWNLGLRVPVVIMVVIILALTFLRWRRREDPADADRLGMWAAGYMLFVLFTTPIGTGIFRHVLLTLMPLGSFGPMALQMTGRRRAFALAAVLVVELALQYWWVRNILVVDDSPSLSWLP